MTITIDTTALDRFKVTEDAAREAAALKAKRNTEHAQSKANLAQLDTRLSRGDESITGAEYAAAQAEIAVTAARSKHAQSEFGRAVRKAGQRDLDVAEAVAWLSAPSLDGVPLTVTDKLPETFKKAGLPTAYVTQDTATEQLGNGWAAGWATLHLIATSKLFALPSAQAITAAARERGWINVGTSSTLPREVQPGCWLSSVSIGGGASTAALSGPAARMAPTPIGAQRRSLAGAPGVESLLGDWIATHDGHGVGFNPDRLPYARVDIRPTGSVQAGEHGVLTQHYYIAAQLVNAPTGWAADALASLNGKLLPGVGTVHAVELLDREGFETKLSYPTWAKLTCQYRLDHEPLDVAQGDDDSGAEWED